MRVQISLKLSVLALSFVVGCIGGDEEDPPRGGGGGNGGNGNNGDSDADTDSDGGGNNGCASAADCDDGDACTVNTCDPASAAADAAGCVFSADPAIDDGDACTTDSCDAATGAVSHAAVAVDDGDACTTDSCDPATGTVSHDAVAVDDADACTTDSCDPATGAVAHDPVAVDDGNACTIDSCDPASGAIAHGDVAVDDGDACTTDSCDPATGAVAHADVAVDDGNACTDDSCDPATGVVTNAAVDIDDGDGCTIDQCDTATGAIAHDPVAVDDGDACTVDACEPATGTVTNAADPRIDDGVACTDDTCDPATGAVSHDEDDAQCAESDGASCSSPVCSAADGGCVELPDDAACNDGQACTDGDRCDPSSPVANAATGCVLTPDNGACDDGVACTDDVCLAGNGCGSTPNDANCPLGQRCNAVQGCRVLLPAVNVAIISEIDFARDAVELFHQISAAQETDGLAFMNDAGTFPIRSLLDPDGTQGDVVVFGPNARVFGVANPADPADIPAGVHFLIGDPGQGFDVEAQGALRVGRGQQTLDAVALAPFHADPDTMPPRDAFVLTSSASLQLTSLAQSTGANDDGDNWCVTLRARDTLGAANQSCSEGFLINEVLYDFQHPSTGSDDGNTFVEISGPGGAVLEGFRLRGRDRFGSDIEPNVLFAAQRIPASGFLVVADGAAGGVTNVANADVVCADCDPQNGPHGLRLLNPGGGLVLDRVGYGANAPSLAEGTPVGDLNPRTMRVSLARDENGTDTNNNFVDFHYDPTPTPGAANDTAQPRLVDIDRDDSPAAALVSVNVVIDDAGDFLSIESDGRPDDHVQLTFAGLTDPDPGTGDNGCLGVDVVDETGASALFGRRAVMICPGPSAPSPRRGDLVVRNAVSIGGSETLLDAWTYTGALNETNGAGEADLCNLQLPASATAAVGAASAPLFGRLFESGMTEANGADSAIIAEVGLGANASDPRSSNSWIFRAAAFSAQAGDDDEYQATLSSSAPGTFSFTYRFSLDGGLNYTYCDTNGAGSVGGADFNPANLGTLTVTP